MTKKLASLALAAFCALSAPAATINATSADIGKVIGADGNVYATVGAASSAGTTAYAMIAYINTDEATGLAIAVRDIGNGYTWDNAKAAATTWAAARPVDFGTWRLTTVDDFKYMFQGCNGPAYSSGTGKYGYGSFHTYLKNCGATEIQQGRYWTADAASGTTAYQYNFYSAQFGDVGKDTGNWARCCLEFDIASNTAGRTGSCRWRYDDATRTLTIYGNGAMADYTNQTFPPWYNTLRTSITNVVIESGVSNVGDYAFYKCAAILEVSLPNGVTNIGQFAFCECIALLSVEMSDAVESIGERAFYYCNKLPTITIPETTASIGRDTFWGCYAMTDVYCHPVAAALTWTDDNDDFQGGAATRIHVRSDRLAAYQTKFGGNVRGTFVGDIPFSSYSEWADVYGFDATHDGVVVSSSDIGKNVDTGRGVAARLGFIDDGYAYAIYNKFALRYFPEDDYMGFVYSLSDRYPEAGMRLLTAEEAICIRDIWLSKNISGPCIEPFWIEPAPDGASQTFDWETGTVTKTYDSDETASMILMVSFEIGSTGYMRCDKGDGIANIFRYAFDKPGDFGATPLMDIGFSADGRAVVKTPPVVNTAGFTYQVLASDNLAFDANGNVATYDLDPTGATVIPETVKTARFFRLRAVEN